MMRALVFCLFLLVVNCFVAVQKIDDLQSFTVAGLTLDGNCVGTCVDPDQPGGARQAVQAQAAPGEYIIPGSLYRSATASGRMDYRELFISSSIQDTPNDIQIETLTEQGFWKINFPTTTDAVYTSILTYDGNSGDPADPFYYDRDVLSLDLTRPGTFSNGSASSLPPAFGFQFLASSDLTSTFSFRVISDDFRGSQLTVTIPQGSSIEIFAPFYLFTAIPAGDSGTGGRGQHKQMTGQPADFTDVSVLSFIFETTKAVDAQLSFVSLITGTINVRVFLDCTGTTCIFDNSDTLLTGVSLTISGDPSSVAIFPTSTVTYSNTTIAPGRSTLDARGYYAFYIDAGVYQVCVGNLPSGVTLVTAGCLGTTIDGCYNGVIDNTYDDIFIDIPATANLALTPPAPTTVDCSIASTATAVAFTGRATATGCGIVPSPTSSDSIQNGCTGEFVITRTWSVTQGSQTRTAIQIISVEDNTRPVIGAVVNTQVNCGACTSTSGTCLGAPSVSDNCGGVINAVPSETNVGNNCIRTFTRTWTAADPCGNTAIPVVQTFTVTDRDLPVFTSNPQDNNNIPCGSPFIFDTVFATDPCQVAATVTTADQDVSSGCNISVRRVFTANDGCSNTATVDQVLTANAAGAPSLIDPPDLTVFCTSSLTPTALASTSTAIDSCTNAAIPGVTFNDVNNPFTNPPHQLGSNCQRSFQRVWSISTNCGGTTSVSQFITVTDNTQPFFSSFVTSPSPVQCASNQCTCVGTAPTPVAGDLCSSVTTTFRDNLPAGDSCVQTTVRVWTATDACGINQIVQNQNIVREDRAAPILSLPIPTAIYPCSGSFSNVPAPTVGERPNAIDCQANVNITPRAPVANVPATTACDAVYTRIWDANDGCGNTASISQTVIVRDSTAPSFSFFPQDTSVDCNIATTATSPSAINNRPIATDLCTQPTLTFTDLPPSGTLCPNGIQVSRVWTATDSCGLATVDTQVFTITNFNNPTITIDDPSITIECDAPNSPTALGSTAEVDTACNIDSNVTFFDVLVTGCPSVITRTFVVTDACNRRASVSQSIRLIDDDAPTFTNFPEDVLISCADSDDPDVDTGTPGVIDNCSTPTLNFVDVPIAGTIGPGLCPGDDVVTRTWTARDACNNVVSQVQTITISNRPPDECDPVECIPQPCDTSSCPVPNCDCCGAPAVNCLPVNCNPQPCNPVDCTPVPCSGCDIDIAVTGCQPRTCPPRYVYVDDDDVENFQKAQPAQANPKVSGASQLVLSCMLLLASVGSIFVALF